MGLRRGLVVSICCMVLLIGVRLPPLSAGDEDVINAWASKTCASFGITCSGASVIGIGLPSTAGLPTTLPDSFSTLTALTYM